jgi:hypothetical protein
MAKEETSELKAISMENTKTEKQIEKRQEKQHSI